MISEIPTALILIFGGLLSPFFKNRVKTIWMLSLPVISFIHLLFLNHGNFGVISFLDFTLIYNRVDKLSLVFGYIFLIATFLNVIYSIHNQNYIQHTSSLVYAGSAIGAVFAGDLITLFIFWELTAISSVFLIWARNSKRSYKSGMRYLITHLLSGMLLLSGTILYAINSGSINFDNFNLSQPGVLLIFLAFGIKSAFPFLHNWLHDAYPEATEIGTVVLATFSTKLAIYCLARGFSGTEILIPIGAVMAAFPIFYAVIENNLRRVLTYSLNNQLGFMVIGIGIGTELAINGAVAHAFAHILYKSLLFMSMGAVLLRTGTVNGTDLGGLYKSMPLTTIFCMIGAASISAFPLFSGFIAKSLIMSSVAYEGYTLIWLVLLFASAGVFHHAGIKIPFFAFFAHDSGKRCKEAPKNMLIAMGIASFLCIFIGCFPNIIYGILPYPVDYEPYTASHVLSQMQLLVFSALAFAFMMRSGIYPPELKSTNLDSDWIYRKPLHNITRDCINSVFSLYDAIINEFKKIIMDVLKYLNKNHGLYESLSKNWPTGSMVLWVAIMLTSYLLVYYM